VLEADDVEMRAAATEGWSSCERTVALRSTPLDDDPRSTEGTALQLVARSTTTARRSASISPTASRRLHLGTVFEVRPSAVDRR
jgi:hypothetical protein